MATPGNSALAGKNALITGAARRIGAVIAARLHAAGASVGIHFNQSAEPAHALADSLNDLRPGSAKAFAADLVSSAQCSALMDAMLQWCGDLDVLVNNASSFYPTPLGSVTEEQWEDLVGSNLKAPLFLSQAAAHSLASRHGSIVNIIDIHAQRPLRDHAVYGVSKAGLAMLTRSLAKDLAPSIRVNGVSPGAILWPEDDMSQQTKDSIISQIPLARPGEPKDIAACVLYLVSEAPYVTGQIIAVDGGRSLGW
jgi:pteridine reductase